MGPRAELMGREGKNPNWKSTKSFKMHPLNPPKFVPGSLPGPSWPFVGPGRSGTQRGLAHLGRPKAPKNDPKYFKSASGRRNKPAKSEKHDLQKPIFTD